MVATLTRPTFVNGDLARDTRTGRLDGYIRIRPADEDIGFISASSCPSCRRSNLEARAYAPRFGGTPVGYECCPECGYSREI